MNYYGSSYYGSPKEDPIIMIIMIIILLILYLGAWFWSMQIVTKAAEEKGYPDIKGKLWFIGLFGLIFTPGIIVAALPDKRLQQSVSTEAKAAAIDSELPSL